MRQRLLSFPEILAFGATRGLIGLGLGLLLSDRIAHRRRRRVAFAMLGIGAASTIPLGMRMFRGTRTTIRDLPIVPPRGAVYEAPPPKLA